MNTDTVRLIWPILGAILLFLFLQHRTFVVHDSFYAFLFALSNLSESINFCGFFSVKINIQFGFL